MSCGVCGPGATASDTCAGSLAVTTNSTVNANAVGVYTNQYTATDPSGNSATNTRTVYVVDTDAAGDYAQRANPLTNECHAAFVDPGATANDTCAGSLARDHQQHGQCECGWRLYDPLQRHRSERQLGHQHAHRVCGGHDAAGHYAQRGQSADQRMPCGVCGPGGDGERHLRREPGGDHQQHGQPECGGVYTIKYTATDPSGNSATNTRTVYVVDTTPPVITLNGANPLTNECHAAFVDPGRRRTTLAPGAWRVTTNSTVNPNAVGVYTINYSGD